MRRSVFDLSGVWRRGRLLLVAGVVLVACCGGVSEAWAETAGPGWMVVARTLPTDLRPGGSGRIFFDVYNVGAAANAGSGTVTDTLPEGVRGVVSDGWQCSGGTPDTCTHELPSGIAAGEFAKTESGATEALPPALGVSVEPEAKEGSSPNLVTVTGGGAPEPASTSPQLTISSTPASFGFASTDAWASNRGGTLDTQAGSHPYELAYNFVVNTDEEQQPGGQVGYVPAGGNEIRDLTVNAPAGVIGDPYATPQCTDQEFYEQSCPPSSQIGIDYVDLTPNSQSEGEQFGLRVFNMVPPSGVPAQFAFTIEGVPIFLDAAVRSGGDYGITEHVNDLPQRVITANTLVLWGVPPEASHDPERCSAIKTGITECDLSSDVESTSFLTLPTQCTGQPVFSAHVDSWRSESVQAGSEVRLHGSTGEPTGFTGCDSLNFGPSITAAPDTTQADTPAGLTVEVKVPQEGLTSPEGLSKSDIENTTVTLPEGLVINPGQAAGLQACQSYQDGVGSEAAPSCPSASKVGEDEIETPLLKHNLKGNVYILQSNPPELKLLVAASGEGVNLKLVGEVDLNPSTGRLTSTFKETPELPFTDFKLTFNGGERAALSTPTKCGIYASDSDFMSWSSPFLPEVFSEDSFLISGGTGGAGCPSSSLPFNPSLTAGATTDQAGGYTDFSMLLSRGDDQQRISTLQFKAPAGLSGMISKVPLCDEADANAGTCPAASQIGYTTVEAGPGPYPLVVPEPGQPAAPIYLTGGYKGAPYGLSIVVPLHVGPFTLQTQIVRAKIEVDPFTAQLTITTDPLPQIIDGIPTDLRTIDAVIDKPEFMFNPTNCKPQEFNGTATGAEGASAPIATRFQVGSCQSLKFAPDFKVSTSGKTSKVDGASLTAKILYPTTKPGSNQASTQANIAAVKVDLPKQLPSRLTTLQKACLAKVFEANPANCPKDSEVGHAKVLTPVLPVPIEGPAYFVSHGGEAFPSLTMVLKGYGVTIDLVGSTFISHAGITSSTFKSVPDVPFTSFELTLPEGPYSALAANGNLCTSKLAMPTAFVGQNGAEIHDSTAIGVTGCAKAKALTRAQKLAKALKACKKKAKGKRAGCRAKARKQFGPLKKAKKGK